jgi:hypothetical protein
MTKEDNTIDCLLDLDGETFVIDGQSGLWVKFEARRAPVSAMHRHGIKYSLSLHDKNNERILGFDNAHPIQYKEKANQKPRIVSDHVHVANKSQAKPYRYKTAAKLLKDFWKAIDKYIKEKG